MQNKRGEFTLLQLATLIAGIVAFFVLFMIVSRIGNSAEVARTFVTRDAGMLADAMLAAPQNVRAYYSSVDYIKDDSGDLGYVFLGPDYVGMGYQPESSDFRYKGMFMPRKGVAILPSKSAGLMFFLMKERDSLYVSDTPTYISLTAGPEGAGSGGSEGGGNDATS